MRSMSFSSVNVWGPEEQWGHVLRYLKGVKYTKMDIRGEAQKGDSTESFVSRIP